MIFRGQVVAQQAHGGQVNRPSLQQTKNGRKSSREPGRGEPMKGLTLTQSQATATVVEHRAIAHLEM